jgi:hypothetical protein
MIQTAGDMVQAALRTAGIVGVGQAPSAEDANDGLNQLNEVIAGWARDRLLAWRLTEIAITSTGAASYTLTDRPVRLSSAFARLLVTSGGINSAGLVDFPLNIIPSRDLYNEISLKSLGTFPAAVYYDTIYPDGLLYVWPIPPAGQFEIHVAYTQPITTYANLTTALGLPPEYLEPLRYTLAIKLAMDYGQQPNPGQVARLRGVMARLRAANWQPKPLEMPRELVPGGAVSGGGISGLVSPFQSVIVLGSSTLG